MITLALSKGRIFDETVPLLARAGITPLEDAETSRKLIIGTTEPSLRIVVVRSTDVPPTCSTAPPTSAWPARTC